MKSPILLAIGICLVGAAGPALRGAEKTLPALFAEAQAAVRSGRAADAIAAANQAVALSPTNAECYVVRARVYAALQEHPKALIEYMAAAKLAPTDPDIFNERGMEQFRLGRVAESVADFDRGLELAPQQKPYHWQRGISLYYAGRYADGVKQFQLHRTVNPNDVENAVWLFLCAARERGVEAAGRDLIPISGDTRVPMMEIYALFGGKGTEAGVLAAINAGSPGTREINRRKFYADLYLGLFAEARGESAKARTLIAQAAQEAPLNDYMGDVARVHASRLSPAAAPR